MIEFIFLSIANAFISYTVARSVLFQGFRDYLFNRADPSPKGRVMNFFSELVSCPYCFSHWVAFVMVAIWQPKFTNCGLALLDLGVSAFAMVGVSSLTWAVFEKLTHEE